MTAFRLLGGVAILGMAMFLILPGCGGDEGDTIVTNIYTQDDPFDTNWKESGHADSASEAFRHWDDTGTVSTSCARCHGTEGFLDFIGADGSAAGVVNVAPAAATNDGVNCDACHSDAAWALTSVQFPGTTTTPGKVVSGLGHEAICMQCHQGRESTITVNAKIASAGAANDDTADADLSFRNVHYAAAGATRYGKLAGVGYEYAGKSYEGYFGHESGFTSCYDCHDKHTLEVKVNACAQCHDGVTDASSLAGIRMPGSTEDYDGDGNVAEGIKAEIEGLAAVLYAAIQAYPATQTGLNAIYYDSSSHPYWFEDAASTTSYSTWTNRLIRATYNYQFFMKDHGAYAHNAKYVIALLYDAIADINAAAPVTGFANLHRNDAGHFDPTASHWGRGTRPSCSKCHNPEGFKFYIASGGLEPLTLLTQAGGLTCNTCHTGTDYLSGSAPLINLYSLEFPSGVTVTASSGSPNFICGTCHSGRESAASIDAAIAAGNFSFLNVHYFPAAAVLYGSDAHVAYEYAGQTYKGDWTHFGTSTALCKDCHVAEGDHSFVVKLPHLGPNGNSGCSTVGCHDTATSVLAIRKNRALDYDGDGSATENLADEIATLAPATGTSLANELYARIRTYASGTLGTAIVFDAGAHPYWFVDTNANGVRETTETTSYDAWDGPLMRAAHNFQISQKEPGAWAHNTDYIAQVLIDAIDDLGGSVAGYNRP